MAHLFPTLSLFIPSSFLVLWVFFSVGRSPSVNPFHQLLTYITEANACRYCLLNSTFGRSNPHDAAFIFPHLRLLQLSFPPTLNGRHEDVTDSTAHNVKCTLRKKYLARKRLFDVERLSLVLASDGSISSAQLLSQASLELEDGFVEEVDNFSGIKAKEENCGTGGSEKVCKFGYLPCPPSMRDFISCQESFSGRRKPCETTDKDNRCVVRRPRNYARPFRWPQSQNQIRAQNVPSVPLLSSKSALSLVKINENIIHFLPVGPNNAQNADVYIENLLQLVPILEFGKRTRLVLNIGGGTGSLSLALEKRGALTINIIEKESAENGVQLILERGFPGLLQTFCTHRLPYPDQAFDLFHCADCTIPWLDNGGLLLLEADRLVRAGGFIILINTSSDEFYQEGIVELSMTMCWKLSSREGNLMIWQKTSNKSCHLLHLETTPHACDNFVSSNTTWNTPLTHCPKGAIENVEATTERWPLRLISPPVRLQYVSMASMQTAKEEAYLADLNYWKYLTSFYLRSFGSSRAKDIRNVIDMNAAYGGFAAAVSFEKSAQHWWILNVVPVTGPDCLPVIFDRGLLGLYHDWCKALDIYPRTFDMLHASALFSAKLRCKMTDIVLEMDRILRPGGFVLVRDKKETIIQFQTIAISLGWKTTIGDTESGPKGTDKLLHCQKL